MRLLLDSHAFIWWLAGNDSLSKGAVEAIGNSENEVFVSAASAWEIVTKFRIGKMPEAAALAADLEAQVSNQGFAELPITIRHGRIAGGLPGPHRDPFDRMLAAQAMCENLILVTNDPIFTTYAVHRFW